MDIQETSNSMASSMPVIKTNLPKGQSSHTVNGIARCSRRNDQRINPNVTLQDPRKALLFIGGRGSKVQGSGHIRGAVAVLATRVTQVHFID